MATSDSPLNVPDITLAVARPSGSGGGSEPNGEPSISSVTDNGDGTVAIQGVNFGSKEQAAPVLADYVGVAYENGTANTVNAGVSDGDPIPTARWDDEPSAIWDTRTSTAFIRTTRSLRHGGLSRSYYGDGDKAWWGKPLAYGGENTPAGKNPFYISWWQRARYSTTGLWGVVPTEAVVGTFIKDEPIVCNGEVGIYAGNETFEGSDFHFLDFGGYRVNSNYAGFDVVGQTSGAVLVFPSSFRGGSGTGYETPGSKLLRSWDNPDGSGGDVNGSIRCTIASRNNYAKTSNGEVVGQRFFDNFTGIPYERNGWMHIEAYLDLKSGKWRMLINAQPFESSDFAADAYGDPNYSPTVSLIGTDGGPLFTQETDISEIYFDKTPQRVYLGNAATRSAVTHWELQRPLVWAADAITVSRYDGALTGTMWAYVVGPDGSINEQGVQA